MSGKTTSPIETQVTIINSENVLSLQDVSTIFSLFTVSLQLSLPLQYSHNFMSVHIVYTIFPLRKMPPQFSLRVQFPPQPVTLHNMLTVSQKTSASETAGAIVILISAFPFYFCRITYLQAFGTLHLECFRHEPGSDTEFQSLKKLFY